MPGDVIQTDQLTRHFGRITAVDQISLQVPERSIYGFLGPNGAGKTTTIRMLLSLIHPDAGDIRILGLSLPQQKQTILSRLGALVELPSLYPHLSGYENLDITRRLLGKDRRQIANVLNIVGLEQDAPRLVRDYSFGMRQRLALALALLGDPQLLVLDEPTNGLDPAGIQEMRMLLKHLATERGITVFLSSHLLGEVEQIATHIGIVAGGRLVFQGELDALRKQRMPYTHIQVDRPELAIQLLSRYGYSVALDQNGRLRVATDITANPAQLTALLVQHGIAVSHISQSVPSLEDLFLNLTQGKE